MKRVIIDFDNTMGVPGCDIDDALALLFVLGNPGLAQLEGICTTYGNNQLDVVHENTLRQVESLGLEVPVAKGAAGPEADIAEAARFLADTAAQNPGEISVLATGSLTNLKQAGQVDSQFYQNVREFILMGGITESLMINGRIMNELNFSCDGEALYELLASGANVTIATSHSCLPALFTSEEFEGRLGEGSWLYEECAYWVDWMKENYGVSGFVCWDIVAAAAMLRPDLFEMRSMNVTLNQRLFDVGYLEEAGEGAPCGIIKIPQMLDSTAFKDACFQAWERF